MIGMAIVWLYALPFNENSCQTEIKSQKLTVDINKNEEISGRVQTNIFRALTLECGSAALYIGYGV